MRLVLVGRGVMEQIEVVKGIVPRPLLNRFKDISVPRNLDLKVTLTINQTHVGHVRASLGCFVVGLGIKALKHFMAAQRDCTRAIGLQAECTKSWYRRGQAWAGWKLWSKSAGALLEALRLQTSASGRNQVSRELDRIKALKNADRYGMEIEDIDCPATISV